MKHKRKLVNKFLNQFDAIQNDKYILYLSKDNKQSQFIWSKEDDMYGEIKTSKIFTLKQFRTYVVRLFKIKSFW